MTTNAQQVAVTGIFYDLPLVVLTVSKPDPMLPCIPQEFQARIEQLWVELQAKLATLSSNSRHLVAEKSSHCIHCNQPEMVIDAIRRVIDAARKATRLTTP